MIIIDDTLWIGAIQLNGSTSPTVKAVNDIVTNVPLGQPVSADVTTNDIGAVDKSSVEIFTIGG